MLSTSTFLINYIHPFSKYLVCTCSMLHTGDRAVNKQNAGPSLCRSAGWKVIELYSWEQNPVKWMLKYETSKVWWYHRMEGKTLPGRKERLPEEEILTKTKREGEKGSGRQGRQLLMFLDKIHICVCWVRLGWGEEWSPNSN